MCFLQTRWLSTLKHASLHLRLNGTLIGTQADTELTLFSPLFIPTIHNSPKRNSSLNAPTDQLNSVESNALSRYMLVDAALVGHKVFKDLERCLDRSIGENLRLDLIHIILQLEG